MANDRINLLENIQKGISPSYLGGFTKIVNLDLDSLPGGVVLQKAMNASFPKGANDYTGVTFTAAVDDLLTIAGTPAWLGTVSNGLRVRLTTTVTLPAGLSTGTDYWMYGGTGNTTYLASSIANLNAGTPVDITGTGTGVHTLTVQTISNFIKIINTGLTSLGAFAAITDDNSLYIGFKDGITSYSWSKVSGNAATTVSGLAYWKDYLFVCGTTAVDVYGPLSTPASSAWTNAFLTITTSTTHPSLIMSNDILYIGCGADIASIEQPTGKVFAPADASTYTFSSSALDLPAGEKIVAMEQLGSYLYAAITKGSKSKLYPWDTISSSFEEPIRMDGNVIDALLSTNNQLYIFCGDAGQIYACNGSTMALACQIPPTASSTQMSLQDKRFVFYPNAVFSTRNKIYFGLSSVGTTVSGCGVYSLDLTTGKMVFEYTAKSLNETNVKVYSLCPFTSTTATNFFASFADGSLAGTYAASTEKSAGTFVNTGYFETGLLTVGTKYQPRTFRWFEIECGAEMLAGTSITLSYRINLTDSYTTIGTLTYASDGAVASKIIENSIVQGDQIQFKVTIASTTYTNSPELKAIYVY